MSKFSRRSVVVTGASAGLILSAPQWLKTASAQQKPYTRFNATSAQGKAMLKIYEKAVGDMMNKIPKGDPRNWEFQWYSHWVPGPINDWNAAVKKKNDTIQATYPGKPPSDPHRKLAAAMWDGCQAHGDNPSDPNQYQELFFLPWHRYFIYYFEQIIRNVSQNADFSLPYWNYLGGPSSAREIPPEFRVTASPLYRPNRNTGVKAGKPIDVGSGRTPLNSNAFKESAYIKTIGNSQIGFCPQLDGNPHGAVHVDTGNGSNMGSVPTAAGDPVFWIHHSEIDRLWESWNRLPGRHNPAWPTRSFVFANGSGGSVLAPVAGADRVALLGYQYDNYYVPPGVSTSALVATAAVAAPSEVKAVGVGATALGNKPMRMMLKLPSAPVSPTARLRLAAPAGPRSLYLVLSGIMLPEAPGDVVYDVYLDLPEGAKATPADPHYVGTLNFFHIMVGMAGHDRASPHHSSAAFNVTDTVKALQSKGQLSPEPSVTLIPNGEVKGEPMVGSIELVES